MGERETAQERRLLASFDKTAARRRPVLVERWGEETAAAVTADARREYETLLPEVTMLGNSLFDYALGGTYEYLAYYKTLKRRDVSIEEIGGFFADSYHALVARFPAGLARVLYRLLQPYLKWRIRREAARSQENRDAEGWRYTFIEAEDGGFGIDVHDCAVCAAFARHDASEAVPYLCALDDEMSTTLGMGLRRNGTRALGAERCDFRYRAGGEPKPLRATHSLPVVSSQRSK